MKDVVAVKWQIFNFLVAASYPVCYHTETDVACIAVFQTTSTVIGNTRKVISLLFSFLAK